MITILDGVTGRAMAAPKVTGNSNKDKNTSTKTGRACGSGKKGLSLPPKIKAKKAAHAPTAAYLRTPVQTDDIVKFFRFFKDGDTVTMYQTTLAKNRLKYCYVNTKRVFAHLVKKGLITAERSTFQIKYRPTDHVDLSGASVFDRTKSACLAVYDLVR